MLFGRAWEPSLRRGRLLGRDRAGRGLRRLLVAICAVQMLISAAHAGGPRFVSGTTFCCSVGNLMAWYTSRPQYFTDPGDLSATVSHAQADAMVAAAANVWNVPTANITLTQGGELAEHVSGDGANPNTYFNGTSVVFPTDVEPSNYAAVQIAVIYDTDGSVTDTILGDGASDPSGCRQTGVTESVDAFGTFGTIEHAEIVLNGRCVGSAPQQLLQMQYQLTRAFGQVLGLAWSQLNDNVFTGSPAPTEAQMAHWPLMHPIDVICGTYTYQCTVNGSKLTDDDLAALELLYPVTAANMTAGETLSLANADSMTGYLFFPTGQGMDLVNVTVKQAEPNYGGWEPYQDVSGLSGFAYQQDGGNPVSGTEPASKNSGRLYPEYEQRFYIGAVPVSPPSTGLLIQTETVNPLYMGDHAIGPYERPPIAMSGSPQVDVEPYAVLGAQYTEFMTQTDASPSCDTGNDGTQPSPAPVDPSGWWNGLLCPTGHSSWWTASVKANRTFTVETTALDEAGNATVQKAQPVLGVWDITNAANPVMVGSQPGALNALALGVTQLRMPASATDATVEFVVADQYGAGRPDFAYRQRFLYADSVSPAVTGSGGGQITITGTGFQQGNQVTVRGVAATVLSCTATQIVADVPPMAVADPLGSAVDVAVTDLRTEGSTVIKKGLTYVAAADVIQVVSSPASLTTGTVSSTPFAVRVFASDGVAPVAQASVQFAVVSGSAVLGCASGSTCAVGTDATGLAQITLTGGAPGSVTVTATVTTPGVSGVQTVQITIAGVAPAETVSIANGVEYLAAGASGQWSVPLLATSGGEAAAGVSVVWTAAQTGLTLSAVAGGAGPNAVRAHAAPITGSTVQSTTNASGMTTVSVQAQAIAAGSIDTVTGCAWGSVCATWTVYGIAPPLWTIGVSSGAGQSVATGTALGAVALSVTDGAGHALPGATVTVFQTTYAWEGACPAKGVCAAAPVLKTSQTTAVSDAKGLVQVTPLEIAGVPQVVEIAAATGTQGFCTMSLTVTP